jgi:hypothetical protein
MADVPGEFIPGAFCLNSSFTGSIHEIDSSITLFRHLLSRVPRSDPLRIQPMISLGSMRLYRHTLSNQREDLDKAIVLLTELIFLPPLSWLQDGPFILRALLSLAIALLERSKVSKQPKDAIYATEYLFFLRDQSHAIPRTTRHQVTDFLIEALAFQVELEAGNVMQIIREMARLCRELTLDTSDVDATDLILRILNVVVTKMNRGVPDQPEDELIECLRTVWKRRPDLLEGGMTFAISLVYRYSVTSANDDYKEATSILDEIIAYSSPGNSQDERVAKNRAFATGLVTELAIIRSDAYQTPEYLEEAIYRTRTCVSSSSYKEVFPHVFDPEATAKERSRYFGSIKRVEESSGNSLLSQPLPGELKFSQAVDKMEDLLFVIRNKDDTTKIDEVVEQGRSSLKHFGKQRRSST